MAVTCVADDLIVVIHAKHRTLVTLREAFELAKSFVNEDKLAGAEAVDTKDGRVLAEKGTPWR